MPSGNVPISHPAETVLRAQIRRQALEIVEALSSDTLPTGFEYSNLQIVTGRMSRDLGRLAVSANQSRPEPVIIYIGVGVRR